MGHKEGKTDKRKEKKQKRVKDEIYVKEKNKTKKQLLWINYEMKKNNFLNSLL